MAGAGPYVMHCAAQARPRRRAGPSSEPRGVAPATRGARACTHRRTAHSPGGGLRARIRAGQPRQVPPHPAPPTPARLAGEPRKPPTLVRRFLPRSYFAFGPPASATGIFTSWRHRHRRDLSLRMPAAPSRRLRRPSLRGPARRLFSGHTHRLRRRRHARVEPAANLEAALRPAGHRGQGAADTHPGHLPACVRPAASAPPVKLQGQKGHTHHIPWSHTGV